MPFCPEFGDMYKPDMYVESVFTDVSNVTEALLDLSSD
jgi:hypothetical protein